MSKVVGSKVAKANSRKASNNRNNFSSKISDLKVQYKNSKYQRRKECRWKKYKNGSHSYVTFENQKTSIKCSKKPNFTKKKQTKT